MKISLPYVLRAVSALFAILLGVTRVWEEIFRLQILLSDQPQSSLLTELYYFDPSNVIIFVAAILCGVLVLVVQWNLLIPLWLFFFGIFLFDPNALQQVWEDLWNRDWITILIFTALLAFGLAPAAIAYALERRPRLSVARVHLLSIAILSLPIVYAMLLDVFLVLRDVWSLSSNPIIPFDDYIQYVAVRVVLTLGLVAAAVTLSRGYTLPLIMALALVSGGAVEAFHIVAEALR